MADTYAGRTSEASIPARRGTSITPTDGAILTEVPKALYIGVGGDITMVGVDDSAGAAGLLFKNVSSGAIIPFRPREIKATGTTATNIIGLL